MVSVFRDVFSHLFLPLFYHHVIFPFSSLKLKFIKTQYKLFTRAKIKMSKTQALLSIQWLFLTSLVIQITQFLFAFLFCCVS